MEVARPRRGLRRRTNNFSLILTSVFFFFFNFQPKATRAGDEKHRKKAHGLTYSNECLPPNYNCNELYPGKGGGIDESHVYILCGSVEEIAKEILCHY